MYIYTYIYIYVLCTYVCWFLCMLVSIEMGQKRRAIDSIYIIYRCRDKDHEIDMPSMLDI